MSYKLFYPYIPVKRDGVDCHVLQIEIGSLMCQEKCQQINNIFFFCNIIHTLDNEPKRHLSPPNSLWTLQGSLNFGAGRSFLTQKSGHQK